jgi:hypothetical protein
LRFACIIACPASHVYCVQQIRVLRQMLNQVAPFGDCGQNSVFGDGDSYDSNVGENVSDDVLYPYN